jgi:hypothetical protein
MTKLMKLLSLAFVFTCGFAASGLAQQPEPAKMTAAQALLKASGAVDVMLAAMRASLPAQREAMPQVPAEFWTRFDARIVQDAPELSDSIAVVYTRKFSLKELNELTAFFNSSLGKKMRQVQPDLVAESAGIGQRWGARIGAEIAATLGL